METTNTWFVTEAFDHDGKRGEHAILLNNISRVYPDSPELFETKGVIVEFGPGGWILIPMTLEEFTAKTGRVIK